jgi:hypothetical protein
MLIRLLATLLLTLTLLPAPRADAANFSVKSVQSTLDNRVLHVNARFELPVNPRIEEAIRASRLTYDWEVWPNRWWWWNRVVTDRILRRRIQFHALSRQYLVSGLLENDASESFGSLGQALVYAGTLDQYRIVITAKKEIEADARYLLVLRARLDIEALPMLMRPLAYATPSWRRSTGWTEWPIERVQP